ncbi:hypothetical protein V6N11_050493 [Hibiscus sabdariffa]|uniref:Uncharacterized protein n=2 Tax=Hibiscus sabdariffa TaxID=183260 RepID=A0ABR2TAL8_9ROSI
MVSSSAIGPHPPPHPHFLPIRTPTPAPPSFTSLFIFSLFFKANRQQAARTRYRDEDEQRHHGILKEKAIEQRPWRGSPRAKG